jgi:arginyl-tRNA synthetase
MTHQTGLLALCDRIAQCIKDKLGIDQEVVVTPLEDLAYGHLTTNCALRDPNPEARAAQIVALFDGHPDLRARVAGKGFVNFRLTRECVWHELRELILDPEGYGRPNLGMSVSVDHTDVNPTGLPHAGHARLAVIGDTICNLLEWAGCKVYRDYILNDCGNQIDALMASVRARQDELAGNPLVLPEDGYRGEYIKEIALLVKDAKPADVRQFVLDTINNETMRTLGRLGVRFDQITSEQTLQTTGAVEDAVRSLEAYTYHGTLPPPRSHSGPWVAESMLLLRSGSEKLNDIPLRKNDGHWTYFAGDIAFHRMRLGRKVDLLINVFGADHHAHAPKLQRAVSLMGSTPLECIFCEMVSVMKDGKPLRMSKRAGNYLTCEDLIDQLGADVLRVAMLVRSMSQKLVIDVDLFNSMSKDNPYHYIQYAYARTCSLLKNGGSLIGENLSTVDLSYLVEHEELEHAVVLMRWPYQVHRCCKQPSQVHHLLSYARTISQSFHAWWCSGTTHHLKRFVTDDRSVSKARLALVYTTQIILRTIMSIIGIVPQERLVREA